MLSREEIAYILGESERCRVRARQMVTEAPETALRTLDARESARFALERAAGLAHPTPSAPPPDR